uniref:Ras homolog family member U n=1 Tax=Salvator merianae TaxID=96440 RepID=A0A8D0E986_SALMN
RTWSCRAPGRRRCLGTRVSTGSPPSAVLRCPLCSRAPPAAAPRSSACPRGSPAPEPGGCRRSRKERPVTSASRCRGAARYPRCLRAGSAAAGQQRWAPPWAIAVGPERAAALEGSERNRGAASSACWWETARWARRAWWSATLPTDTPRNTSPPPSTISQDEFDKLRPLCYTNTDVFLLCFSVVSPSSFQNVNEKWVPEIRRHCPKAPIILVGTQSDLREDVKVLIELDKCKEKPVAEEAARLCAEEIKATSYIECSALTQKNLKEVFDAAIVAGIQYSDTQQLPKKSKSRTPNKMKNLSKSWWKKYCCFV